MKKLVVLLTGLFFAASAVLSLQAKDDSEVIDKLSNFKVLIKI